MKNEHIGITERVRVVRTGPVERAPKMDRASACGQGASHRLCRVEAFVALESVNSRVVVRVPVGQNLLGMSPGDKLHASVEVTDRLQWHPEGQLAVLKARILERLILVPRRGRTDQRRLGERMIHVKPCLRSQDLTGNGRGISAKFSPLQLMGKVMRANNLRDARRVLIFFRASEIEVGTLVITNFLIEKADDDSPQFDNFFGRSNLGQSQVAVSVQMRNLVRAERRMGKRRFFQND